MRESWISRVQTLPLGHLPGLTGFIAPQEEVWGASPAINMKYTYRNTLPSAACPASTIFAEKSSTHSLLSLITAFSSVTSDRYERCCDGLRYKEELDEWGRLS